MVTGVAEGAFGKREDLGGRDGEHEDRVIAFVVKDAAKHFLVPSSVPLGGPRLGEAFKHGIVGELDCITLHHNVEPAVPAVAAGR